MDCVINRHGSVSSSLLIRTEIDDIHRRIRDKGTFDRDDLEAILAHYWTIDPEGIFSNAEEITELRERLDAVGRFENLVPQPNSDALDDIEHHFQKQEGGHHDVIEWYDPKIPFGSITNHDSTVKAFRDGQSNTTDPDEYISCLRYNNDRSPPDTGYEIEFAGDMGYPTITLRDRPA